MKKQLKKNKSKLSAKRGQSSVEYLLIIGAMVAIVTIFGSTIRNRIGGITDKLFSNVDSSINNLTQGK